MRRRVSSRHSTFNSNFSLQELEAFINDQACHPNGVLDFPEFLNVLSRLICDSLDVAVMPVMPCACNKCGASRYFTPATLSGECFSICAAVRGDTHAESRICVHACAAGHRRSGHAKNF